MDDDHKLVVLTSANAEVWLFYSSVWHFVVLLELCIIET